MSQAPYREPSGWTTGAVVFAGVLMILIGVLQIIQAVSALLEDEFFVVTENYVFDIDVTAWGWIHLVLGLLVLCAGYSLLAGNTYGRILGLVLAGVSVIVTFAWVPYYPFWSLLMIALAIWVIWSLTRPGALRE